MPNINERPVCHRAEDLVTYLYGEASEVDAKDFAIHLKHCDACRSEFGVFQQVHDSILLWRKEALGSAFSPASVAVESTVDSTQFVRHERKLTALAALREFFSVSPFWLRGATAFAALLLCVLGLMVISRSWSKPTQIARSNEEKRYSEAEVAVKVNDAVANVRNSQTASTTAPKNTPASLTANPPIKLSQPRHELARSFAQYRSQRTRGLTRQEKEQLLADLRLIPGRDEEELPLGLPDEPNQ